VRLDGFRRGGRGKRGGFLPLDRKRDYQTGEQTMTPEEKVERAKRKAELWNQAANELRGKERRIRENLKDWNDEGSEEALVELFDCEIEESDREFTQLQDMADRYATDATSAEDIAKQWEKQVTELSKAVPPPSKTDTDIKN
jgi:chromosome segregation ATPase